MQSGGRRGGGAYRTGIHGLIPFRVGQLGLDIGRQGHFPQALQSFQKNPLILEPHQPVAVLTDLQHLGGKGPVSEGQPCARLQPPSGADQTFPDLFSPVDEQQYLSRAAAGLPATDEPGGEHAGVVEHQAVPWPQEAGQIVKVRMAAGPGLLVQHQKPGGVPALQRRLGNELLGELEIKVCGLYG